MALSVWLVEFETIRGFGVYIGLLEQEQEERTMMSSSLFTCTQVVVLFLTENCLLKYRVVVSWGYQAFCTGKERSGSRDVSLMRRPVF